MSPIFWLFIKGREIVEFNLADLFEYAVDNYTDREYIVGAEKRRTYGEVEARANQLAHHLQQQGVKPGDHVGIYAYNCVEWVETLWAILKIRAVFININYRYVEEELDYLFENANLVAMVYQRKFAPQVKNVLPGVPALTHTVVVDDDSDESLDGLDSVFYDAALEPMSTARDFQSRSGDDHYILYTGGTTGMPKGVVWRQEDVFFALGGGLNMMTGEAVTTPQALLDNNRDNPPSTSLATAPLMHGAAQWAVMARAFIGDRIVLMVKFSGQGMLELIEKEKCTSLLLTGDAMANPFIDALDKTNGRYDTSSITTITSSAVTLSPQTKDKLLEYYPDVFLLDAIGSSESGSTGLTVVQKGKTQLNKGGLRVQPGINTTVLDEDFRPLKPGSGITGKLARSGNVPLCYYRDPEKSAETFITVDGVRYVIPGDYALYEEDGTITMLGRGSVSINSGGEKIFPEEVEIAVKTHPGIFDVTVVGVPDQRWGNRVTAVVQTLGGERPTLEEIQACCREHIAGYKIPREIHYVDQIVRSPSGKPDYRWASEVALAASH